ncbi:SpoIIIAH-like family protein [Aeribacillus alveayuensis]|uniref:Stage III sporulation protein AH n=1 Tax=Aeribacillus alveayuensis TaxID=279215 RepID=A0ABT9VK89_9BACI|nr:stage III sporulation protein AH [Bacillus alveayuensis]
MLKKQTVWLLTMLSLVVVLSVYYITSPEGEMNSNVALSTKENGNTSMDEKGKEQENDQGKEENSGQKEKNGDLTQENVNDENDEAIISSISNDDLFTAIRMEIEDERSMRKQQLESIIGSNEVSAEEKSKAYEEMRELSEITAKEKVLETLIKSKGYGDALVQADGDRVRITVKAKEHSKQKANEIIHLVKKEISGMQDVAVTFHPAD